MYTFILLDFLMNEDKNIFLKDGWKERLDRCEFCTDYLNVTLGLPFLLSPPPIYEPDTDVTDTPQGSIDETYRRSIAALEGTVPRAALLESLYAVNKMKDALNRFLKPFAQEKRLVKREDILSFFQKFQTKSRHF